jgi:hypothetical protein
MKDNKTCFKKSWFKFFAQIFTLPFLHSDEFLSEV